MAENPALFVRVSTPAGHFTVAAATAERAGSDWRPLAQDALDKFGHPLAPKPREDIASPTQPKPRKRAASKPRGTNAAATPTPANTEEK